MSTLSESIAIRNICRVCKQVIKVTIFRGSGLCCEDCKKIEEASNGD